MSKNYDTIANLLISKLETAVGHWEQPWDASVAKDFVQMNAETKRPYNGVNWCMAYFSDFVDNRWLTFPQVAKMGGTVEKGSKATSMVRLVEYVKEENDKGEEVKGRALVMHSLFNVEQTDLVEKGVLPARPVPPVVEQSVAYTRLDSLCETLQVNLKHHITPRAFYSPSRDAISLPYQYMFKSEASYNATKLHELGHWTGHKSRFNRDFSNKFGTKGYALEELVAETFSIMMMARLGLRPQAHEEQFHSVNNSVLYIKSWLKALREDPKHVVSACSQAQKACDWVILNGGLKEVPYAMMQPVDSPIEMLHVVDYAYTILMRPYDEYLEPFTEEVIPDFKTSMIIAEKLDTPVAEEAKQLTLV